MNFSFRLMLCCCLVMSALTGALAQQPPKMKDVPPGGYSPAMFRQEIALVREANANFFKTIVSYTAGKANKAVANAQLPVGDAVKQCRVVVLFKKNVSWLGPLQMGEMSVENAKLNTLLEKYSLKISKWYDADPKQDGLVLKVTKSGTDLVAAAEEISRVADITMVFVKAPK